MAVHMCVQTSSHTRLCTFISEIALRVAKGTIVSCNSPFVLLWHLRQCYRRDKSSDNFACFDKNCSIRNNTVTGCIIFEPQQDKTNKMTCAPSEDIYQPRHPPSLIRVFAVRMKKHWVLSYQLSALRRLWSDAQAGLNRRWAHRSFCWFCHEGANLLTFSTKQVTI